MLQTEQFTERKTGQPTILHQGSVADNTEAFNPLADWWRGIMSGDSYPELDQLDLQIIKEMETDGRQSISQLARRLHVGRPVAARKLQRLFDDRIVRVVSLAAPPALGYQTQILTGIKVQPKKISEVANQLASFQSVSLVATLAGRNDILIWALFRDSAELSTFLVEQLSQIPGIVGTETMIALEMRKISFTYLAADDNFYQPAGDGYTSGELYPQLDEADMQIIAEMERDGRQSVLDLAVKLNMSRPTVHAKLQRLLQHRVIKVIALCRPRVMGFQTNALIGINVSPREIDEVADRLSSYPNVHMVAITAGGHDIIIMTLFHSSSELSEFVRHDLGGILNVTSAEVMMILDLKKLSLSLLAPHTA